MPEPTRADASPYRPEFEAALRLVARVSEAVAARGFSCPIPLDGEADPDRIRLVTVDATGDRFRA